MLGTGVPGWIARAESTPPVPAHRRTWSAEVGTGHEQRLSAAHAQGVQRLDRGVAGDRNRGGGDQIQRVR